LNATVNILKIWLIKDKKEIYYQNMLTKQKKETQKR